MFGSRRIISIVVAAVVVVLLLGVIFFISLGGGGYSVSSNGDDFGTEMVPVDPSSPVEQVSEDPAFTDLPARDRPPESELRFRNQSLTSTGEILGIWEPDRWLADRNGGPAKNRADGYVTLSNGDLIEVPAGADLSFLYGDRSNVDFFDALAFEVEEGELFHGKDIGILELWNDSKDSLRPIVLPVAQPELVGEKKVRVTADIPPGVYVISVAVSVPEGDARYNFRVLVEQ